MMTDGYEDLCKMSVTSLCELGFSEDHARLIQLECRLHSLHLVADEVDFPPRIQLKLPI